MPGHPITLGHSRARPVVLVVGASPGAFYIFHLFYFSFHICSISWEAPRHGCSIVVLAIKPQQQMSVTGGVHAKYF